MLKHKKNILVFIDWFWPGYLAGGPIQSIVSMVASLSDDFNFKIFTTNTDLDGIPYRNIQPNEWIHTNLGCEVYYADKTNLSYKTIKKIITDVDADAVYLNSFLSFRFSIIPLMILKGKPAPPVILAPRGMLGKGALSIKSKKKKLFLFISKISALHANIYWHATSPQELEEINNVMNPKTKVFTIQNIPKTIGQTQHLIKKESELYACFISRINEKKNLLFALQVLKSIEDVTINYTIYGPTEDSVYWQKCLDEIKKLPSNIVVKYAGALSASEVEIAYGKNHILFLPTLNENYGHAIVESLLCGCPVIISDQTPWNDLAVYGAGEAIPLNDLEAFRSALNKYAKLNGKEFDNHRQQALSYISSKIDLPKIKQQYKDLFNECIQNRSKQV